MARNPVDITEWHVTELTLDESQNTEFVEKVGCATPKRTCEAKRCVKIIKFVPVGKIPNQKCENVISAILKVLERKGTKSVFEGGSGTWSSPSRNYRKL